MRHPMNQDEYAAQGHNHDKKPTSFYIVIAIIVIAVIAYLSWNIHYDRTHTSEPLTPEQQQERWQDAYENDPRW